MREGRSAEPRDGDCACGSHVLNDDAARGGARESAEWRSRAAEFPAGGCARWRDT